MNKGIKKKGKKKTKIDLSSCLLKFLSFPIQAYCFCLILPFLFFFLYALFLRDMQTLLVSSSFKLCVLLCLRIGNQVLLLLAPGWIWAGGSFMNNQGWHLQRCSFIINIVKGAVATMGSHGTECIAEAEAAFDFSSFLVLSSLMTLVLTGLLDLAGFFSESFSSISISVWSAGNQVHLCNSKG